jgi:hypothetical protein
VHYTKVERLSPNAKPGSVRQLGRTLGIIFYAAVVATFTVVCSAQICLQVWAPEVKPLPVDCAAGTLLLVDAIDAARLAAFAQPGEQAALAKFRGAVAPAWAYRPALGKACAPDREALRRLREIDRLRYAEEHAVRYGSVDLALRRYEVKRFITTLRQTDERTL